MSTIVLGCDKNGVNDSQCQNTVAKILEKAGHTVEKLSIAPGPFADYSYSSKAKGKIGVYLMAASLVSVVDLYGGNTQFKYAYFGIRGDASKLIKSQSDFESKKIPKDHHGDCTTRLCDEWAGKTYPEINNITKSKCQTTFGKTPEELGNAIVKAMGGETSSSSDESKTSSSSSCKDAIQKLLKHWDGEVECHIRNGKVFINKIREPQSSYRLVLEEGVNVFSDSVKITDVNPKTVNHLVVRWSGGTITFKDEELIARFGDIKKEVQAVKKIVKQVSKTTSSSSSPSSTSTSTDSTSTDGTSTDTSLSDTGSEDVLSDGDTASGVSDGSDSSKTTVIEKPITKYQEALQFGNIEWNKIKRDNGHSIECQTHGSPRWVVGEWVKVILPSFNEYGYMYITRCSQSDDGGDWTTSLTLTDYPPGWGTEETSDNNSNNSNSTSTNVSSVIDKIISEINKFSYSHSCSDGNCIKSTKKGDCWALSDYIAKRLKSEGISAQIYQYKTSGSNQHRQVKYKDSDSWVMFPYSKSSIDHNFYTNSIPAGAKSL